MGKKPNIVFILTDNFGYGELGVYGGRILAVGRIALRGFIAGMD
jgi:arylsulfatase A-like enzyme